MKRRAKGKKKVSHQPSKKCALTITVLQTVNGEVDHNQTYEKEKVVL